MRKYLVERLLPGVGKFDLAQLRAAAELSNEAVARLAPDLIWLHGFVLDDSTVCVFLARDEQLIRRHGELIGHPVHRILEVRNVIDPSTASAQERILAEGVR